MLSRALIRLSGVAVAVLIAPPAGAATSYTIVNLSALVAAGARAFVPTALNDAGQIVGYDPETLANGNAGAAYLIDANGAFASLANTGNTAAFYIPAAISNSGQSVAGQANNPGDAYGRVPVSGPVVWSLLGGTRSHQNYRVFAAKHQPNDPPIADIANGNVPVGGSAYFGFKTYAVTPLRTTGCAIEDFSANAINDVGRIVGSGGGYAAADTLTGCPSAIPGLPRPANASTSAIAVNAAGDLIVSLQGPAAPAFGAYYLFAKGTLALVPLPATLPRSTYVTALAINAHDAIVGNVAQQEPPFAPVVPFLYQNGRSIDLNTLLPAKSGWRLTTAAAINDAGEIIGTGYLNGAPQSYALHP